jgi:hypothetical protein
MPLRFDITQFSNDMFERKYLLDQLGITIKRATRLESFAVPGGGRLRKFVSSREERRPVERRRYILELSAIDCRKLECQTRRRWLYIEGYWQDFRFFDHNRMKLVALIQRAARAYAANSLVEHRKPVLAIHVRQELGFNESGCRVMDLNPLLDHSYYVCATRLALWEMPVKTILIFGDDIEFRRALAQSIENMCSAEVHIVAGNSATSDLLTMSSCDALVLSGSTFGWWGAYLNPAAKLVFHPGIDNFNEPIPIPSNWRVLPGALVERTALTQ